jgi:DNA topoisomerase-1
LKCEKCDDFYLLRDGAAGIFLAASQFPKHRETRAPRVDEITPIKDQLDPKYKYLADAPAADPQGNPAMVRFLRKTKEQYVMTEVDGKATGWRATYHDGKWVEELPPVKVARKKVTKKKVAKKIGKRNTAKKKVTKKKASKRKASKKKAGPRKAARN